MIPIGQTGGGNEHAGYNPSHVYSEGDLIWHDGVVKECWVGGATGEYDPTKWVQTPAPMDKLYRPDTGAWENAQVNTEYLSPNQEGGVHGVIYRMYITPVACPGGQIVSANFPSVLNKIMDFEYVADLGTGWYEQLPYNHRTDSTYSVECRAYNTGFWIEAGSNNSVGTAGFAWVDYAK
jgi:hypothetical protein